MRSVSSSSGTWRSILWIDLLWAIGVSSFFPRIAPFIRCTKTLARVAPAGSTDKIFFYKPISPEPLPRRIPTETIIIGNDVRKSSVNFNGVTSLLHLGEKSINASLTVLAGTKQGRIQEVTFRCDENGTIDAIVLVLNESDDESQPGLCNKEPLPLPVYSAAESENYIFFGGADRYVTVWKKDVNEIPTGGSIWKKTQKLGPHTGWVKDLVYDDHFTKRLYSIGCNCIEVWEEHCNGTATNWRHCKKLMVRSSNASLGATLSTDLLCLSSLVCSLQREMIPLLVAGGVDGRIHCWDLRSKSFNNERKPMIIHTFPAHEGRVNVLASDASSGVLFSGSHDGSIKCWSFETISDPLDDCRISEMRSALLSELKLLDDNDENTRITSLIICGDCSQTNNQPSSQRGAFSRLCVAGTQSGYVFFIRVDNNLCDKDGTPSGRTKLRGSLSILGKTRIVNGPMINALCYIPMPHRINRRVYCNSTESLRNISYDGVLVVAHSQGMGTISMSANVV